MTPQNRPQAPAASRARGNTAQPHASRPNAPTRNQNRKRNATHWTPHELTLLRTHYPLGGTRAVIAAGVNRTTTAIHDHARKHGIRSHRPPATPPTSDARALVLAHQLAPKPLPIVSPARPKRVTDALHALAETPNLTPREYEREKARILTNA